MLERNGNQFRLLINKVGEDEEANLLVFFYDVTNYENLKDRYNDEKTCVGKINIDNYDELIASTSPEKSMSISAEVDKNIRKWAAKMNASINKMKDTQYIMYFQNVYVDGMIDSKFSILDDVRPVSYTHLQV